MSTFLKTISSDVVLLMTLISRLPFSSLIVSLQLVMLGYSWCVINDRRMPLRMTAELAEHSYSPDNQYASSCFYMH